MHEADFESAFQLLAPECVQRVFGIRLTERPAAVVHEIEHAAKNMGPAAYSCNHILADCFAATSSYRSLLQLLQFCTELIRTGIHSQLQPVGWLILAGIRRFSTFSLYHDAIIVRSARTGRCHVLQDTRGSHGTDVLQRIRECLYLRDIKCENVGIWLRVFDVLADW